ncbi:MAG: LamG domain-containing protein, partial [Psychrobium sp.]
MQRSLSTFTNKLWRMLGLLCFSLVFSSSAYAVQCLDIFPNAHPEGGDSFNSFSFPNFNNANLPSDLSDISAGVYGDIVANARSTVRFTTRNGNYTIKSLTVYNRSTIEMEPGDYWIESIHFGYSNTLNIRSNGTVRIFVKNRFRTYQNNRWNKDENGQLMIYAGNLAVDRNSNSNSQRRLDFTGAIYTDNLTFNHISMRIIGKGSIASDNNVSNSRTNGVSYSQSTITNTDFKELCEFPATPVGQWNLDEVTWAGSDSVIDSVGSNHGTPFGGLSPSSVNPVFSGNPGTCNNGDFDGQDGYFQVDNTLGNDFTMMAWIRPRGDFPTGSYPYHGYGLFWSDVGGAGNDFLVGALRQNDQNRISFMVGGTGDIAVHSAPISLNQWTHITVTRKRNTGYMAIYINGILSNSIYSGNTLSLTSNAKIAIGGNPLDNRYFDGNIDEIKFYQGVLNTSQITSVMNETRPCPNAGPTVEYRFDNFHTFAPDAVLDSSGNDNHGTAFTASNAQGLLCTAADFSAAGDANYIVANSNALNGLSDFTAMAWIKTTQTHDSTIFSAANDTTANEAVFYFDDADQFWPTITASPFDTDTRLNSTVNINDGQWHQVVWTREAATRRSCLFVDGVEEGCVTHPDSNDSNSISVAPNGLVIGQEQDELGGDFEIEQSFDGLMDEFMIFDYVMPEATIAAIDNNIRSNKNWDGTPRAACPVAFPTVDMRFDETSWNGSGSVLDSSGNNFHGTPFGAAAPISGMSCNALNLRQTGINDYVALSNQAVNGMQDFSVVFWGKLEANHNMSAISGANTSQDNELLMFFRPQSSSVESYVKGQGEFVNRALDNEWHQYALTREAATGTVCLYRDGVLLNGQNCRTGYSSSPLSVSPNGFVIGQEQDDVGGDFNANQAWDGLIDELLIFPAVLTQTQIQEYRQNIIDGNDWRGLPKACNDTVDHYRFEFSATGLTCAASNITLRACEDSTCSNEATINTSLVLSPLNNWTGTDVTGSSVSFTGSTNLFLSQNTLSTVSIGGGNLNPVPSSATPVQCYNGSTAINCEIAFKDTGFLFNQIPTQISGKPSNTEFNKKALTIKAVAKNSVTGVCENVFANNTDVILQLKTNCHADIGNCSNAFITKEGGTSAEQINGTYSDVTLRFGADSTAQYSYEYFNAGE